MLRSQQPIIENFGLAAYGCCENLTDKIHLLRCIRNLRMIAVTPVADVRRCAEQIGADYVFSWQDNPADIVCPASMRITSVASSARVCTMPRAVVSMCC